MLVSFASMNIFSNAMALNSYMDDEDYTERYERFYKDESFREDYYNYHKQHHQQEQQQQSHYNDYGYNDDKKISYSNNDYDNDNRYSNYPIKDKIHECQTGQFEGFLVSSPEFCDLEIPSGSPDVGQIPPENIYTALGPINSTDSSGFATSSALCMQGDIAVGGGFVITSPEGLSDVNQITSIPPGDLFESNEQEWLASVISSGETDVSINAVARCLNNQPS
jgi:hypothetical protein